MDWTVPPRGILWLLLSLLVGAAVYDVRYRRIPNWLTVSGVLSGIAMNSFLYEGWPGLRLSLGGFAVAFGVYVALYALRAMGAGDVKLMAAVGALVGWRNWFGIFVCSALVGGVMAMILMIRIGRVKKTLWNVAFIFSQMKRGQPAYVEREELDVRSPKAVGLPHGAVIAVGTLFFLAAALRFAR
jgi:prepilin peptidase CpaA